jgi:hypothetical protein
MVNDFWLISLLKQIEKKMIFLLDSFFQEIKLIINAEI